MLWIQLLPNMRPCRGEEVQANDWAQKLWWSLPLLLLILNLLFYYLCTFRQSSSEFSHASIPLLIEGWWYLGGGHLSIVSEIILRHASVQGKLFYQSCWLNSRSSPLISLGFQLLCGLFTKKYHQIPSCARILTESGCSLHSYPLFGPPQIVWCEGSWICWPCSIQGAATVFSPVISILAIFLLPSLPAPQYVIQRDLQHIKRSHCLLQLPCSWNVSSIWINAKIHFSVALLLSVRSWMLPS